MGVDVNVKKGKMKESVYISLNLFFICCYLSRHCRHLHETGYLKNITVDHESSGDDPLTTDLNRCKYALHYVKSQALKELEEKFGNCTINGDHNILNKLRDLTIFSRFLAKQNILDEARNVREEIDSIIDKKCKSK